MSRFLIPWRFCAAFLCGWLVAFLHVLDFLGTVVSTFWSTYVLPPDSLPLQDGVVLFLLFPPVVGVVACVVSMDRRNKEFLFLASSTGMLAVAGWFLYWLPEALHGDTAAFIAFWAADTVLVLVSSLVTSLLIHFKRRARSQADKAPTRQA